jgi:hypothetical protein
MDALRAGLVLAWGLHDAGERVGGVCGRVPSGCEAFAATSDGEGAGQGVGDVVP